jgi:hypothetical protein
MIRRLFSAAFAIAALLGCVAAHAQPLYAASLRSFANAGSQIVVGNLFTINLANSQATLVAPIKLEGTTAVGITGLAVHPATGVFYGITSGLSPDHPHSLVKIDPKTGDATLIGKLNEAGSDVSFDPLGTLYIWLPLTRQIGTVSLADGHVTPLGLPGAPSTSGGLAIDSRGIGWITPNGATGTLDSVDIRTGVVRTGPTMNGAPYPAAINAMTFTPSGLLIAVNSNAGVPQSTQLVSINTSTGAVAAMGALPDDTDALTFAPQPQMDIFSTLRTLSGRVIALIALGIGSFFGLIGYAWWQRRARRRRATPPAA